MDSSCMISQLEALHQRLSSLEQQQLQSVLGITLPSKLGSRTNFCEFSFAPTAVYSNLADSVKTKKRNIRMWLSTMHSDPTTVPKSLKVIEELQCRKVSYAVECPLSITLAELRTESFKNNIATSDVKQVIAKFRKVDNDTSKMTEIEGQHAVDTYSDPEVKDLFPHLYFITSVGTIKHEIWECIGIEKLDNIWVDNNIWYWANDICSAYLVLKTLHSKGYTHGDSHMGNFMRVPLGSTEHPVDNPRRIIMIDQDSIRRLPVDKKYKAAKKYLMIHDFNTLLLWNNPYVRFLMNIIDEKERRQALVKIYRFSNVMYWMATPFNFADTRDTPLQKLEAILSVPWAKDYLNILNTHSMSQIHGYYDEYFKSKETMESVQNLLVEEYNNVKHRELPQIWKTLT